MRVARLALAGALVGGLTLAAAIPASAAVGVYVGPAYGPRAWGPGPWRPWYGPRYGYWAGPAYYPYPYPYPYYRYPPPPAPYYDGPPPRDYAPPPGPQAQDQQQSWYYCEDPQGYYPYVEDCRSGWHSVPAEPPPQQSEPPQQTPPRRLQP